MRSPESITGKIIFFAVLEIGAKTYRFCTSPAIELTDADGDTYLFDLSFDFEEWIEESLPMMDGLPNKTVGITLNMSDEIQYISALGIHVASGKMTLYKGYEGNLDYESLISLFSGKVGDPIVSHDGTFAFNLYNDQIDRTMIFDSDHVISSETFSAYTIPDGSNGAFYPIIIGSPGYGVDGVFEGVQAGGIAISANWDDTDPFPLADTRYILAGHKLQATNVFVRASQKKELTSELLPISEMADDNGVTVSYIDLSTATSEDGIKENTSLYIGFDVQDAGLHGISGVGDFLIAFLSKTEMKLNWNKIFSVRAALNEYKIDTQITENINVWEFVFQNVLSFLPISYLEDGEGLYFLLWDLKAEPSIELVVGRELSRIEDSGVSYSSFDEVINKIVIRGAKNSRTGKYAKKAVISGNKNKIYADPRLVLSREIFGERELEINLDHIADSTTILKIAQAHADRYGLPYRVVEYLSDIYLDFIDIGDCVSLTDDELSIDEKAFLIGKKVAAESIQLKFIIF